MIRSLVLASTMLLAAPSPLAAQSDETCIDYMEADAANEAASYPRAGLGMIHERR